MLGIPSEMPLQLGIYKNNPSLEKSNQTNKIKKEWLVKKNAWS